MDSEKTIIKLHKTLVWQSTRYLSLKWHSESVFKHFLGLVIVLTLMIILLCI